MTNEEMRTTLIESLAGLMEEGAWRELAERALTLEIIDSLLAEEKLEITQPRN